METGSWLTVKLLNAADIVASGFDVLVVVRVYCILLFTARMCWPRPCVACEVRRIVATAHDSDWRMQSGK